MKNETCRKRRRQAGGRVRVSVGVCVDVCVSACTDVLSEAPTEPKTACYQYMQSQQKQKHDKQYINPVYKIPYRVNFKVLPIDIFAAFSIA